MCCALFALVSLAGCLHEDDHADDPTARIIACGNSIASFRASLAAAAGANAVAPKGLQTAEVGDIWILSEDRLSVMSRSGSAFNPQSPPPNSVTPVTSPVVTVDWERSFLTRAETSLEFLNVVIDAAFRDTRLNRMSMSITVVDTNVTQLQDPNAVLTGFESTNTCIRGNVMFSAVVSGRMRLEYRAFDSASREFQIDASLIREAVNASLNYEYLQTVSGTTTVLQESPQAGSAIAANYLAIDPARRDDRWIELQVRTLPGYVVPPSRTFPTYMYTTNEPFADFRFERVQRPSGAEWRLKVLNEDPTDRTVSFQYVIDLYDGNRFLFQTAGTVSGLTHCAIFDAGIVSNSTAPLANTYAAIGIYNIVFQ